MIMDLSSVPSGDYHWIFLHESEIIDSVVL